MAEKKVDNKPTEEQSTKQIKSKTSAQNKEVKIPKTKPVKQRNLKSNISKKEKQRLQEVNKTAIKHYTHDGHKLTLKEEKFIQLYVETGNQRQSVIQAGYQTKRPDQYGNSIVRKKYIIDEINFRLKNYQKKSIADADEIMQYYTRVMRGDEKDQFGLEAPLSERTKAASELAKRMIDIPNKLNGREQAEVKITLNWEGMQPEKKEHTIIIDTEDPNKQE